MQEAANQCHPKLASPSGGLPSAVRWAHLLLEDRVRPGDLVIDATAGNGNDTLFLARCVEDQGHVFAFDVQAEGLEATRRRLTVVGINESRFTLVNTGHEHMSAHLPEEMHGHVRAVMFNLGYLPGSDKKIITRTETTMRAVQQALGLLAPGGLLTVVVYPGHTGGAEELRAMEAWASALPSKEFEVQRLQPVNRSASPPELWVVWKRG